MNKITKLSKAQAGVIKRLKKKEILISEIEYNRNMNTVEKTLKREYDGKMSSRYFFTSDKKTIRRRTLVKLEELGLIRMIAFRLVVLTKEGVLVHVR